MASPLQRQEVWVARLASSLQRQEAWLMLPGRLPHTGCTSTRPSTWTLDVKPYSLHYSGDVHIRLVL